MWYRNKNGKNLGWLGFLARDEQLPVKYEDYFVEPVKFSHPEVLASWFHLNSIQPRTGITESPFATFGAVFVCDFFHVSNLLVFSAIFF